MMNTLIPLVPEVKEMTHRVPGSPGTKTLHKVDQAARCLSCKGPFGHPLTRSYVGFAVSFR